MAAKPHRIEFDVLDMRTNYDLRLMQRFYDELMISAFAVRQCLACFSFLTWTLVNCSQRFPDELEDFALWKHRLENRDLIRWSVHVLIVLDKNDTRPDRSAMDSTRT